MLPRKSLIVLTSAFVVFLYTTSAIVEAADTHYCYYCENEDCEDPGLSECNGVKENGKCFIRYDINNNDVIEMGCLSQFTEEDDIEKLIKNKTLYVCDGVNCNDFAKLPNPNQCTECTSSNEEACATKPTTITKQQLCKSSPYTHCYERVIGEITERGCLNDLEGDDFYECLTGADNKCKICQGTNCNENNIPSNRKQCHRCNSLTDVSCETSPSALSACPAYNEKDLCVAMYENEVTKRGCQSEFVCNNKLKNCEICSNDGCNTFNIKKRFDNIHGIFQELPLNCNTCEGDDCAPDKPRNPNKCEGDPYQDCMTVFDASGKVIRRGCEDLVLTEHKPQCDLYPDLCFSCKANGCNDITDPSIFQECLYCDATSNPDCLFNSSAVTTTRKCTLGCISSLYPRKSNPKVLDFVRTCFEDIEADDQESCMIENNCVNCLDYKCNTDVLPTEGRLSCLHCNGSDCDIPTSKLCVGYDPNDMCYIYFDNVTSSAVRMGCRSEIPNDKLRPEIKQYFICDGDDCNNYDNLPEALFCAACDSENDINCAIDPTKITTRERCETLPYTHCFTRVRNDGQTERGCLSKLLTDDFISCHDGLPSSKCRVCTESDCNKGYYPSSRRRCHRCNSTTDANCEYDPNVVQPCPIYQANDACITQWTNGTTLRACASEVTCEGLGYKNCRTCSNSACNNVNLANEDIGDVGLFTSLPLRCHKCSSIAECKNATGAVGVCEGDINQSCTTVFDAAGEVLARGCYDSLESTCANEGNKCYGCKSQGCNVAKSEDDYIDCIHCDAKNGDNCTFDVGTVKRTRKCYKSCMTALYPRSLDKQPVYELIRSCLDDKDPDDRNKCESSEDNQCKSCSDSKCNKDVLGSRKSCYQCKGNDCKSPKTQACRAVMDNDQCFLRYDERSVLVEMGCRSQYDSSEVDIMVKRKYLWLCDGDNCNHIDNSPKSQTCVLCNSRSDERCATKPNVMQVSTTCDRVPYTECYSRILENHHTERGCLSSLEDEEFADCLNNKNNTKCLACTGNKCNQELYPKNRLSCHICSSTTSAVCESNPDDSQVCPLFSLDDKCITSIDINGNTARGCSSKMSCGATNITVCQECIGDGCNKNNLKRKADGRPGLWQSLPLKCSTCNNPKECSIGFSATVCSVSDYCMTVFDENGNVMQRGCSGAVEKNQTVYCDLNPSNCLNCNSNLCNQISSLNDLVDCIYCDSKVNPDCSLNPSALKYHRKCHGGCMTALYPNANNYSYEITRTCLNDKDPADQMSCSNGSSNQCKSCSDSDCNTHKLPEKRLSCYHCDGESCAEAQQSECSKYKSDDKCFMLFNNESDIVRMGCISDLGESFVSNNIHALYMCNSGDNCNSYENIPSKTLCSICNSYADENCASNPEVVPNITTCSALPNTHCYTKVDEDGSTQRGCVNSLSVVEINACLSGIDSACSVCTHDRCNTEIFPTDRRSCHRCNTKNDPKCENSPNFASVCPVYAKNQYCATKLVNGHTYRGCSTEFQCDDSDKQHCRLCHDADNCNLVDLANNNIGYPGNWEGAPINCYTCENDNCNEPVMIQACKNNNNQNCVTVFAPNGTVVQRGCSDLVYGGVHLNYCDENPGYCKFCKSSGCNIAKSLADFGECLFCEGADSSDCIINPGSIKRRRSCHKGCMTGLYRRKKEENPAYELARGCLDDLNFDDRENCQNGTKPYCEVCVGTSCNTAKIPEHRLKCNVCNGDNCDEPKSAECTAFRENDQCFTLFSKENNVERMGCASDFDNSDLNLYARQLLLCDNDNCNTFESFPTPTRCRSCNSANSTECASSPTTSTSTVCQLFPNTECYTRIDNTGLTSRGCLSELNDDLFADCSSGNSTSCEVCSANNCNIEIYPRDRRSCIQCDSDIFLACEYNAKDFAKICSLYDENESCVTKLVGDRTIRGCASEITCGNSNSATCRACNKTDNCNTVNLLPAFIGEPGKWQDLPLSCYHCKGKECNSGNGTLSKCEGDNLQTCMTVFDAESNVVERGCSNVVTDSSSDYCDKNIDNCPACKSNLCNNANSLDDYIDCYFCDSSESSSCGTNFDASKSKTRKCQKSCMVALYPRNSGNDPSYELTRSCLDDMDEDAREECAKGDKDLCKACNGSRCNTLHLPDNPFVCYKCVGDDCEDMESQECPVYHPNDQCYVLFDNYSSIMGMGCRSEFEIEVVNDLVMKKRMLLCNEKNCNAPESLPTPKLCSVCNSADNPLCATNPNLVGNVTRCASLPYTECVTHVTSDGHTRRGCLASLEDDEFYGCLMNTFGLCKTCVGDKCNEIDVYPDNRRKCHQCNSKDDPGCTSIPNNNKVCEIYKENDQCITSYSDGETIRGCKSKIKCENEKDPRTCRVCDGDGCNSINMQKVIENGFPGRWQEIPITCYTCEGEEECSNKGDFRPCLENPLQNCMTVFNSTTGKVIRRGCSDSVEKDTQYYCDQNPQKCLRCNSNGCNEASNLNQYVECSYCESDIDGNCTLNVAGITATRQCYKFCMTALYPRFVEDNPSYGLSRSCYDDMDYDNRELCVAGKKEHCKICNTKGCNIIDIPEKRHSCYICEGDECKNPKIQKCTTHRLSDKCYTQFDEKNQVVSLGCRSRFSNVEADYLLKQKRLLLCDGENCNSHNNIPDAHTCVLCSSRTNKNCSVDINAVTGETICSTKPYTECYSRILTDGYTERGCLSNLYDDDFLGCLNGTSKTCQSCKGNQCNNEVFPQYRLKCHVCDSTSDPTCEANPNSLKICSLYDSEDTCMTAFRNNVTYRDCSSGLVCDITNSLTCEKCSGTGCNTVNLAVKQDNYFGMWQDLPLTCLSCSGNNCSSEATTESLKCKLNHYQDCMTAFDVNGKIIARGCSDSVEKEYCSGNEANCYKCKSNNCNGASSTLDFDECIYCNSHYNQDCIWNPLSAAHKTRHCEGGCMTALFPSNNGNSSYELIRTCINDKELDDRKTCSDGKDKNCSPCKGSKCNTHDLPENRLSCYLCEGDTCEEPKIKSCPLYNENDQCFVRFDNTNSVVHMGCASSFINQDLESLIKTKKVRVCRGSNCNSLDELPRAVSCAVCNSTENVSCAVSPTDIGTFSTCSMLPYPSCYTKLTEYGTTERGCLTDLPEDTFLDCVLGNDRNCSFCDENGCNREIFPWNRQQCFTCVSTDQADCDSFPTTKMPCPIVSDTESCVTALSGNVTVRGCKSFVYCDANDINTCRSCYGSECNSIDLLNKYDDGYHGVWQELPLKCHTCVEEQCLHSLGPTVTCSDRNINQDCMTVFDERGLVEYRGCSDDVENYRDMHCRKHPENCFKCKSNECNIAWSIEEYVECLFCDSANDSLCLSNPGDGDFKSRKCYKNCMVAMRSDQIIRSCLDDKEMWVQHQCHKNDSIECAVCSGNNCNNFAFPRDRLRCHVCKDSSCSSSASQQCKLYDRNDFCFAKYENGLVDLMGCASSQNASDIAEWTAQNKLHKCEGSDCNEHSTLPQEGVCISCASNKTPNCAQNPLKVNTTETCIAPNNECFTRIDVNRYTLRGCRSNLNASEQSCESLGTCNFCTGEKCNNQIYPSSRRECHICNSIADSNCKKNPSSLQVCPIYDANDKCVSALDDTGFLQRGCASQVQCSNNGEYFCNVCDTNACNTVELTGSANVATNSLFLTLFLAFAALMVLKY